MLHITCLSHSSCSINVGFFFSPFWTRELASMVCGKLLQSSCHQVGVLPSEKLMVPGLKETELIPVLLWANL